MLKEKLQNIIDFIEQKNNVKLYEYQKQMLKWILEGYTFSVPIKCGRKLVLQGYIDYLKETYYKHMSVVESEKHITLEDVFKENNFQFTKENKIKDFKREYESAWIKD